jgi:hypothetical protein
MSKMRKTHRLRDGGGKRHIAFSATRTKRQNSGPLHGMFSEEKIVALAITKVDLKKN